MNDCPSTPIPHLMGKLHHTIIATSEAVVEFCAVRQFGQLRSTGGCRPVLSLCLPNFLVKILHKFELSVDPNFSRHSRHRSSLIRSVTCIDSPIMIAI